MTKIDQSRFDNQYKVSDWLDSAEATALLEVKRATLYAYVSRGLVAARGDRRKRRYKRVDIERLATRRNARRGHGAVAAAALRWGEPVLDTHISEITEKALYYRGLDLSELVGRRFEDVANHLWRRPESAAPWKVLQCHRRFRLPVVARGKTPLIAMRTMVPLLAVHDGARLGAGIEAETERARSMVVMLGRALAPEGREPSMAQRLVGPRRRQRALAVSAINAALVATADHGLNVSTFAARVAASAGADLYACFSAALAAFSGPRHGGACAEIESLLSRCGSPADARALVRERGDLGLALPGFGHPLYPDGDVRAPRLLALAAELGRNAETDRVFRLIEAARVARRDPPAIDIALVAMCAALRWPRGHATGLFAIGRAAGWFAHIVEQRDAGYMLRPRARAMAARG